MQTLITSSDSSGRPGVVFFFKFRIYTKDVFIVKLEIVAL